MWLDSAIIIEDSTFLFNYKCKNIYLNTVLHSTYDFVLLVLLQNHKMLNISLRQDLTVHVSTTFNFLFSYKNTHKVVK